MKNGYTIVGLDNPKTNINVGSALRAVGCYGANMLVVSGRRHSFGPTDTQKEYRQTPYLRVDDLFSINPYDCVPIAVDLIEGSIPLPEFEHPKRGYYIFGAEDATLGKRITDKCKYVIHIPTNYSMNLAAAVNVVLYDKMIKKW